MERETLVLWTVTRLALGTGAAGLLAVTAIAQVRKTKARAKRRQRLRGLAPILQYQHNGSVSGIEPFGEYAARQVGLQPCDVCYDAFKKVAEHYVQGNKSKGDTSRDELMALAVDACSCLKEDMIGGLTQDLVKELDACILSFFAFHWDHADMLLAAASAVEPKRHSLKRAVLSATRTQRYKQLLRSLGPQRQFTTLVQQLKKLRTGEPADLNDVGDKEVAAPVEEGHRSPVILFMAGGMGAGKSTVRQELMQGTFWRKFAPRAVVVEADAFKETDVVFQALSEQEGGVDPETAALVHSSSVKAALSLLVAAINEGRDIIFDGTMSWEPFVAQTIEMVRDAHLRRYRLGPGYQKKPDGSILEQYWEVMPEDADIVEEMRAQQQSHVRAYDKTQAESRGSNGEDDNGDESASEPTESVENGGGNGVRSNDREGSDAGRDSQNEAHSAENLGSRQDGDEGVSGEQGDSEEGQDLFRKPSGHWAHVEGTTLRSNQPSQGPSGFSTRNGAAPRRAGPADGPNLDHAEKQQGPATNDMGHRPGLVQTGGKDRVEKRRPYRVEMVGVACDAGLSVVRGMRRAILTGRGVPIEAQLRSHRMFAAAFERYACLVDRATLYVTNGFGSEPELVALKDGLQNRLLVDPPSIAGFRQLCYLNEKATSVAGLYKEEWGYGCGGSRHDTGAFGGAWAKAVLCEERPDRQARLQEALRGMDFCSLNQAAHWEGKKGRAHQSGKHAKK